MRYRYKIKKKRKQASVKKIISFMLVCIVSLSIAYSAYVTNLQIEGTVTLTRHASTLAVGNYSVQGLNIVIGTDGTITIDGTYTGSKALYARLTGIFATDMPTGNTQMFQNWINNPNTSVISYQGERIRHSVEIISGSWNTAVAFNVVLRTEDNVAVANCKLSDGIFSASTVLTSNAVVEYLYIYNGATFTNLKIKPQINEIRRELPTFAAGESTYRGITCTVSNDGTITINGTATNRMFVKLTNGLDMQNSTQSSWQNTDKLIGLSGEPIKFSANIVSGSSTTDQCNLCLRDSADKASGIIALTSGDTELDFTPTTDLTVMYLFIQKGAVCNNLIIRPTITNQ